MPTCQPANLPTWFPGDQILYEVEAVKMVSFGGVFKVTARVDGEPVARCELSMGKAKVPDLQRR
ncbi:MAG: hypothetical protein NZT92_21260 [Abditibacteriales bacterium]|nr:hypothetical protein [Abditibacteriales bacterium]MDW8367094.1 hypothetical protein [Abditibacteriales bacterium]